MTKNFEEEYKKYATSNVPDLWGRIEAAIDEAESIKDISDRGNTEEDNNTKTIDFKRNKVRNIRPYITAIAAAACLFLAIGVIRFIGGASKNAETASAPMAMESASEAMADSAPAAAYEEAAEAPEEYYDADNDIMYEAEAEEAEEMAPMDESAKNEAPATEHTYDAEINSSEPVAMAEEAAADEAPMADGATYAGEAEAAYSNDESLSLAKQNINSERKSNKGIERTDKAETGEIKLVCKIKDLSDFEKSKEFTAIVTDPLKTDLKKDKEIRVKVGDDAEEALFDVLTDSKTNEYTLILQPEKDGTYTLVSAEIKK